MCIVPCNVFLTWGLNQGSGKYWEDRQKEKTPWKIIFHLKKRERGGSVCQPYIVLWGGLNCTLPTCTPVQHSSCPAAPSRGWRLICGGCHPPASTSSSAWRWWSPGEGWRAGQGGAGGVEPPGPSGTPPNPRRRSDGSSLARPGGTWPTPGSSSYPRLCGWGRTRGTIRRMT